MALLAQDFHLILDFLQDLPVLYRPLVPQALPVLLARLDLRIQHHLGLLVRSVLDRLAVRSVQLIHEIQVVHLDLDRLALRSVHLVRRSVLWVHLDLDCLAVHLVLDFLALRSVRLVRRSVLWVRSVRYFLEVHLNLEVH